LKIIMIICLTMVVVRENMKVRLKNLLNTSCAWQYVCSRTKRLTFKSKRMHLYSAILEPNTTCYGERLSMDRFVVDFGESVTEAADAVTTLRGDSGRYLETSCGNLVA